MNRAKNKTAAKRIKIPEVNYVLKMSPEMEAKQETVNQEAPATPRVWFKIWELTEPGLYVASTGDGLLVVHARFINDGTNKYVDILNPAKNEKHCSALANSSVFQKIKE